MRAEQRQHVALTDIDPGVVHRRARERVLRIAVPRDHLRHDLGHHYLRIGPQSLEGGAHGKTNTESANEYTHAGLIGQAAAGEFSQLHFRL